MRLSIFILILISTLASAQEKAPWIAFWDEEHILMGYKDQNGTVRIKPKFTGLTNALKFKNIIAVMEEHNGKYSSYYLLKDGKKVGVDSAYVNDMTFDCESEDRIRFREYESNNVGYFDGRGNVIIPAIYNDASPFRNGIAIAIKNAKKICWEGGEFTKDNLCEHWSWKGGDRLLIDRYNNLLVDNFENKSQLDWYSLQISDNSSKNPTTVSFSGKNGKYYNFLDIKKSFKNWLLNSLLSNLSKDKLNENTYNEVTYWNDPNGMIVKGKDEFINSNYKLLESELLLVKDHDSDYFISIEGLNPFIYKKEEYRMYFDDCGKPQRWKYPLLNLVINHETKDGFHQNYFDFLKTDKGYRLLSVAIRRAELN